MPAVVVFTVSTGRCRTRLLGEAFLILTCGPSLYCPCCLELGQESQFLPAHNLLFYFVFIVIMVWRGRMWSGPYAFSPVLKYTQPAELACRPASPAGGAQGSLGGVQGEQGILRPCPSSLEARGFTKRSCPPERSRTR